MQLLCYSECIEHAMNEAKRCPLCKANCSMRMTRICDRTSRLAANYRILATSLESFSQNIPKGRMAKTVKRMEATSKRATPKRLTMSPAEILSQASDLSAVSNNLADSQYVKRLRTINERILSEIYRIDSQLVSMEKKQPHSTLNEETQALIDSIDFPSSPDISLLNQLPTQPDEAEPCDRYYKPDYTIVISTTMLSKEEKVKVQDWAEKFGAIYVSDYNDSVTHVIGKQPPQTDSLTIRSMKTMQAIVNGNWLLPLRWVEECLADGKILKEDSFEFDGDQYSDDEGPRRSRLSRLNNESKLFDGYQFYLFGKFGKPSSLELETLLRSAGARIIESVQDLERHLRTSSGHSQGGTDERILVVGDPLEQSDWEKDQGVIERFTFVQTEWIYSSISAFEPLDPQHFRFL